MTPAPSLLPRRSFLAAVCAALGACGGIPLTALPRLSRLSGQLLEADPAELMVAVQVDARVSPPPGSAPILTIRLTPKVEGAFAPVDLRVPLMLATAATTTGLEPPGAGRRWWIYGLSQANQAELRKVQDMVRHAQAQPGYQRGGTLVIAMEQRELAVTPPSLDHTRWTTWMQVSRREGFFEIWNGTPLEVRELARARR